MGKKKKKIYDKIYWQGYHHVIVMDWVVICRIEEEPVCNGNNYKVYYNIDEDFFISASMNYLKSTILPLEYTDKMVKSLQILLHNMWVGQVLNKLK